MSSYTDFETAFLIAAYHVTEERGEEYVVSGDVINRGSLTIKPNWVRRAVGSLAANGFANDMQVHGDDDSVAFELTAAGIKEAERILTEDRKHEDNDSSTSAKYIDSSAWTGLPSHFRLTWEKRERLITGLRDAEAQIEGLPLNNSAKAQVKNLVAASLILAEAPEPPADLIWELINRAASVAGISSLFVSIIGLFA